MTRRMPFLTVAPNGASHGRQAHPAVPVTLEQITHSAVACHDAGAQAIHLHVRDDAGRHVLDPGLFNSAYAAVDHATGGGLWVQATSEAFGIFTPSDQRILLDGLRVPCVSVALRELIPDPAHEAAAAKTLASAVQRGMAIQYFLYQPSEIARLHDLITRGIVPDESLDVLFALGHYTIGDTKPLMLVDFLSAWTAQPLATRAEWSVCGFGRTETRALGAAMALGGKVRVGFENSFFMADGSIAPDNAARVAQIAELARIMGLPAAPTRPQETP
jgi:3-keto-5-aminohexanoate cleavage enzyme